MRSNGLRAPRAQLAGSVLAIGDVHFHKALDHLLAGADVRGVATVNETEGLDVDVIVIASDCPLEELQQVRVHPRLHDTPAVIVAPGSRIRADHPSYGDTWVLTETGWPLLEMLTQRVCWILSRRRHPARGGRGLPRASLVTSLRAAS